MDIVDRYIGAGLDRVILGTAAVTNPEFAKEAARKYGEKIAVGVDIKDGFAEIYLTVDAQQMGCIEIKNN